MEYNASFPTPFGGRSGASSGPRWADYRFGGGPVIEAAAGRHHGNFFIEIFYFEAMNGDIASSSFIIVSAIVC